MNRRLLVGLATLGLSSLLGLAPAPPRERREPPGRGLSPAHEEPSSGGVGQALTVDPGALEALARLQAPAACVDGRAAGVFPCRGVELSSFLPLGVLQAEARSGSNLWGFVDLDDAREYAVIGLNSGTAIVDVTDPTAPRVVGAVPGPTSPWREAKVYQRWNAAGNRHEAWAYVVSEAPTAGLQIIDLSNLPSSVSLAATFRGFDTAHTIFLANTDPRSGASNVIDVAPVLYIQGSDQGFLALDLSNPVAPTIRGRHTSSYVHDAWAGVFRGSRTSRCAPGHDPCEVVFDWGGHALRVLDFTDKANPIVLGGLVYDEIGYAHSGWISRDGNYLFSFDEGDELTLGGNSRIRVLDITDIGFPTVAAVWTSTTPAIEHNGYVVGNRLYVSYYERGLTILDVNVPTAPREVAFFDTYPTSDNAQFHGAWGVYPFLPSGTMLVSNIDGAGGLFLLREEVGLATPPGAPRPPVVPVAPRGRVARPVRTLSR
ncbi:MAG TPA: choice-of-anchor B family protein [Thermoanaerobaculia bacterium]|nr:choice-of-anchor B family protein [Thermoanaerobaculia bacterium]